MEDHPVLASLLKAVESEPVRGRLRFRGPERAIPSHAAASFLPQQAVPSICIVAADLSDLEASNAHLRLSNAKLLDQSIEMSRSLALEISPPIRLGSGLVAAFTWLARSMAASPL